MKKTIIAIAILISAKSFAQSPNDSAYTKNIPIQARLVGYLASLTTDPSNDSLHTVFLKWRASLRANPVSGTATITIDTIPTVELASLYNYVLSNADGMNAGTIMKSQLSAARTANPYLDRLCTAYEQFYTVRMALLIANGRKLLLGK